MSIHRTPGARPVYKAPWEDLVKWHSGYDKFHIHGCRTLLVPKSLEIKINLAKVLPKIPWEGLFWDNALSAPPHEWVWTQVSCLYPTDSTVTIQRFTRRRWAIWKTDDHDNSISCWRLSPGFPQSSFCEGLRSSVCIWHTSWALGRRSFTRTLRGDW